MGEYLLKHFKMRGVFGLNPVQPPPSTLGLRPSGHFPLKGEAESRRVHYPRSRVRSKPILG